MFQATHQRYDAYHFPLRCNSDLPTQFIEQLEFPYPVYFNGIKTYTMTARGAVKLATKPLVQLVPICARSPRPRTLDRLRLSISTVARATQTINTS